MATQIIPMSRPNRRVGRPRLALDMARIQQLRAKGMTLNEIAALLHCGRGTIARALERLPVEPAPPLAPRLALGERASELARSRENMAADSAERLRLREHARHLAYRRCGDGMQVDGQDFRPGDPDRKGPRWAGIALAIGGILLWSMGCPVPL